MYTSEIDVLVIDVCLHLSVEGSKFKTFAGRKQIW